MWQGTAVIPRLAPTIVLCTPLLFTTTIRAAEQPECRLKQYASLELTQTPNGSLLVPIKLEGKPVHMVLNTAAAFSGISDEAVKLLRLTTKPVPKGVELHYGRETIERLATTKEFAVGLVEFRDVTLMIISTDIVGRPMGNVPLVGSLGLDVLAKMDVELDAAHRKMQLFSQDHCPGGAVYWSKSYDAVPIRVGQLGEIYFPMELDGQKLETTLATGAPVTTLSTDVTRKLFHFDKDSADVRKEADPNGETTGHYRAMALSGGGLQIINAQIQLVDPPPNTSCHLGRRSGAAAYDDCYGTHPLRLGRNVLTKLRIYIAMKEKTLYFTSADAHE